MRHILLIAAATAAIAACSSDPNRRSSPDEFAILTKPPLTVPPDYALKPPRPGETRPEELTTTERTQQLLLGDRSAAPPSSAELAFIQRVGALNVDPSIRAILDAENGGQAEKEASLANRLLFWEVRNGDIVDTEAPLIVEDREAWLNERRRSIEDVIGTEGEVVIDTNDKGVLALPGVR